MFYYPKTIILCISRFYADNSRVSIVGPKAGVLVRARASRVSTVTSGAWSCLVGASSGFFGPTKTFGQSGPTGAS